MSNYIFSVVNNIEQYNRCVGENSHLTHWTCQYALNTPQQNIAIPTHYNKFIETVIVPDNTDGWVIFCHQDFEFLEDPLPLLQSLSPNTIYGPLGMQRKPGICGITRGTAYGQLRSGPYIIGKYTQQPQPVDTLDCCCVIVHTSLLKKQALRFDEQFDFHLYAEDFCLQATKKQIKIQAIQTKCIHYSNGTLSKAFFATYQRLLEKFPQEPFVTMCIHIRFGLRHYFPSLTTLRVYQILVKSILPLKTFFKRQNNIK